MEAMKRMRGRAFLAGILILLDCGARSWLTGRFPRLFRLSSRDGSSPSWNRTSWCPKVSGIFPGRCSTWTMRRIWGSRQVKEERSSGPLSGRIGLHASHGDRTAHSSSIPPSLIQNTHLVTL